MIFGVKLRGMSLLLPIMISMRRHRSDVGLVTGRTHGGVCLITDVLRPESNGHILALTRSNSGAAAKGLVSEQDFGKTCPCVELWWTLAIVMVLSKTH